MRTITAPLRLKLARLACWGAPPLLAQSIRTWVYPAATAYRDDWPFVVRARTGSLFCGRTADLHAYPFSVHGYFEWRNWAVARALCHPGDTLIEIGANIGTETIGFSDLVGPTGRVHAFEPLPENATALRRILALNATSNITLHEVALGQTCGQAQFVIPPNRVASGTGHCVGAKECPPTALISVAVQTLDCLAQELGAARVLFCDAEGAEAAILQGGLHYLRAHLPVLVLEASPRLLIRAGSSLSELHSLLTQLDYLVYEMGRFRPRRVQAPEATNPANWLCLPPNQPLQPIQRSLLFCGFCPSLPGLNPFR